MTPIKSVKYKGKNYHIRIGLGVFAEFEDRTGVLMSEVNTLFSEPISAKKLVNLLTLYWLGFNDGCKAKGIEFPYSLEDFIENTSQDDINDIINSVEVSKTTGGANKRQPAK